jgi:hypothetical protein
MIDNKDKPAFPISEEATDRMIDEIRIFTGVSKREYFAGLAMQGLASHPSVKFSTTAENYAKYSVVMADALLLELSKSQP